MRKQTVCFTGHRKIPPERLNVVARRLRETLIKLIKDGYGKEGTLDFLWNTTTIKIRYRNEKNRRKTKKVKKVDFINHFNNQNTEDKDNG